MMTYLGRGGQYSECGFLGFNMKHPEIQNYADEMLIIIIVMRYII